MAHGVHWMFMSQEKWYAGSQAQCVLCTGLHTMRPVHKASTLHRHRSPLTVNVAIKHITTRYTVTSTHQWSVFIADVTRYTRKSLHVIKKRIWWWHNSFTKPLDVNISHLNRQHQITHSSTYGRCLAHGCIGNSRYISVHFKRLQKFKLWMNQCWCSHLHVINHHFVGECEAQRRLLSSRVQ